MKRRTMLAVAASALALAMGAPQAQTKYKDEYKVSTVVGTAFPWGKGAEIWIDLDTKLAINLLVGGGLAAATVRYAWLNRGALGDDE